VTASNIWPQLKVLCMVIRTRSINS